MVEAVQCGRLLGFAYKCKAVPGKTILNLYRRQIFAGYSQMALDGKAKKLFATLFDGEVNNLLRSNPACSLKDDMFKKIEQVLFKCMRLPNLSVAGQ